MGVSGGTCVSCADIVRPSLDVVQGVEEVAISMRSRRANMTFDNARTNVVALTDATSTMGSPSKIKSQHGELIQE